jgi:multiple sugar transport system substrate-binding protein
VVALARETGRVTIPLSPIDALSCWFTLCAQLGAPPCSRGRGQVVDREVGREALARLGDLASAVDRAVFELNPIRTLTRMATSDAWWYCPLTYSYSNYSRDGYAPHRLAFHDVPAQPGGRRRGATLGGAGLALSARSAATEQAAVYAAWVAEAECQRTVYVQSGGQPGNRRAWEDDAANAITHGFFRATLPALGGAYLRPNFNGFADFQHEAAQRLHDTLVRGGDHGSALEAIDARYALALRLRGG